MSADGIDLAALQREMAAAVMRPLTADEQMQERAPDGRPMTSVAESFIAPNSRLTAFERLEIYNRQYWFRVLGALAEDFPGLRAILGSVRYDALAIAYLTAHPSRSFTLRNLGSKLPEWLEANPRYAGRRRRLAVDVARIEWAFVEAFDSAERAPLTLEQISTLDANSRLALQPHLRLLALDYPADELVLSLHQREKRLTSEAGVEHDDGEIPPAALPRFRKRSTWVVAHRLEFSVYYKRLCREEFLTLSAIRAGSSLVEAIAAGFEASEIPESGRAGRVQQWFADWAELGWICAPELDESIAV
ncbi:MAG TPA: DNA-binding domain-containing protein [Terracidiphilus sp.]|nr:DNA-binding domain-containing protein [Terracidiphilus sp.]